MDDLKKRLSDRIEFLGSSSSHGVLIDISTTGACCHHTSAKEKGSPVLVQFNEVLVKARVVYCQQRGEGFRLGLQFAEMSSETQTMIDEIVDGYSRGVPVKCTVVDGDAGETQ